MAKKTPTLQIKMPIFTHEEKIQLLITQLPDNRSADIDPIMLSQRYNFNPESLPLILQEAELYQQQRNSADILQQYDIQKALNLRTQQNFGQLAQRITPKRTLSDLLVSDNIMQQLHEIFTAIKYREKVLASGFKDKVSYGIGISALFYGDSGTGKTMAAEVLANTIGVDLIKVDLSTVINKYVGETEKISPVSSIWRSWTPAFYFLMKQMHYSVNAAKLKMLRIDTLILKCLICYSAWKAILVWLFYLPIIAII